MYFSPKKKERTVEEFLRQEAFKELPTLHPEYIIPEARFQSGIQSPQTACILGNLNLFRKKSEAQNSTHSQICKTNQNDLLFLTYILNTTTNGRGNCLKTWM